LPLDLSDGVLHFFGGHLAVTTALLVCPLVGLVVLRWIVVVAVAIHKVHRNLAILAPTLAVIQRTLATKLCVHNMVTNEPPR